MTETKTTCDICGKVIPPFIYISTFTIPYQTMELHLHPGDKYSCDFCTECAEKFAEHIEKMKDNHKKNDEIPYEEYSKWDKFMGLESEEKNSE